MRQTNRNKRKPRDKKGKMLLLFNKIGKDCVLYKSSKVIIKVVKNSYKGIFITERCF